MRVQGRIGCDSLGHPDLPDVCSAPSEPQHQSGIWSRRSAVDPQCIVPRNRSLSVIGHGVLLAAASGILVAAHAGRRARTGARSSSRGERDAHGALPKRLHAVRPLDRYITRSLTPARYGSHRGPTREPNAVDGGASRRTAMDSDLPECGSTRTNVDPREQVSDPGRRSPEGSFPVAGPRVRS
jgi:hypothetical protein